MMDDTRELPFSADFSARVLQQVRDTVRRRHLFGSAACIAATVIVSAALLGGLWSAPPARHLQSVPPVALVVSDDTGVASGPPTDPLAVMFPDAEPVARFADQYSAASAPAEERNAFAFAVDTEENNDNHDL